MGSTDSGGDGTGKDVYQEPLVSRYTDRAMQELFSENFKFRTWRKCWLALAEAQRELGLEQVTKAMLAELKKAIDEPIDYGEAARKEQETRHDVMSHVHEYGLHCPLAKGIIHLGATSQFVVCNTDLIQLRAGLRIIKAQLVNTIATLARFADEQKGTVTLGYTHFQPAQPTTLGKRFTLYLQDLLLDLRQLVAVEGLLKLRGAKGTTGTQASYLELFDGDWGKVQKLDALVCKKLGFSESWPVTGQTYPRKLDSLIVKALAGIAESAHKFAVDLRLMANLKILEEPFAAGQTGSSAMAYKRNPMRAERMTGLSRKLIGLQADCSQTAANQWFERTLDDSAIRRMDIPQAFLLANAILKLYQNIATGLVVYPARITKLLEEELPFMATEAILMEAVKKGAGRQEMHELVKRHSLEAAKAVKLEGRPNDLFARLAKEEKLPIDKSFLDGLLADPARFAGAAERQTTAFLEKEVAPTLKKYKALLGETDSTITV